MNAENVVALVNFEEDQDCRGKANQEVIRRQKVEKLKHSEYLEN